MDNENQNINNNEQSNEVKKVSPYKGIEDPAIRAQYEKEYGMINVRLMVSLILIFVCSIAYLFIISDTFSTVTIKDKEEEKGTYYRVGTSYNKPNLHLTEDYAVNLQRRLPTYNLRHHQNNRPRPT